MFLIYQICRFAPMIVSCGLIFLLERRFSLGVSASIYVGAVLLTTLAGAMLLRSAAVGQIGRRTLWGSRLLPWAWIAGYGSLLRLGISNILGSILFGGAIFFVLRYLRHNQFSPTTIGGWNIACAFAWVVLIGMMLFLLRQYGKRYYTGASGLRTFLKLFSAPAGALAVSVALNRAGLSPVGFIVAMIPIAVVFLPMGFLVLIVVLTKLSGKPVRWN